MRVHASNTARSIAAAPTARRSGGTFALAEQPAPTAAAAAGAPRAITGIETLLALQALEPPAERRRRAVRRGRGVLDALDELKLGVLAGTLDAVALRKLKSAAATLGEQSGDPRLDHVLAEIALRAEVELAKFAAAAPGPERG